MIELFYYDKKLKKGDIKNLKRLLSKQLWLDITNITAEESALMKETFNLHPLTVEDLLHQRIRVKVEDFPNYLFSVFYGIRKNKTVELVELDFIIGKNFIISNHDKPIDSYEKLKDNNQRLEKLFKRGNDFLFHRLLDMEIDNFFPVMEFIDDEIEKIEDQVTEKARPEYLQKILALKRLLVLVKKNIMPQREKISLLAKGEYPEISKKALPYFRDVYDHAVRVSDYVDNHREAVSNTYDIYMSTLSNNMNEVMKVLSIIATIALPLTVVSGIYGTNFSILPGSTFLYGFWFMILFMVLLSLGMIYWFKRRGWF